MHIHERTYVVCSKARRVDGTADGSTDVSKHLHLRRCFSRLLELMCMCEGYCDSLVCPTAWYTALVVG